MSIKNTPVECSAEDAIESAFQTLEALKDEVSEGVENQREHAGIAATSRFQILEETVSTLEEVVDNQPDWCSSISSDLSVEIRCSYTENRSKGISRAGRRDNAVVALGAAADGLRDWATDQAALLEVIDGEKTEEQRDAIGDRDEDEIQSQIDEANELADSLDGSISTAENAEFPGMRG